MTLREMPCQELVEVVTDYLEGRLSPTDRTRFEEHLGECPPCRDYLAQFRGVIAAAGRLTTDDVPPAALETLGAAFRTWTASR